MEWLTPEIITKHWRTGEMNNLFWLRSNANDNELCEVYEIKKRNHADTKKLAKKNYYKQLLENSDNGQKTLWLLVNLNLGRNYFRFLRGC